MGMFRVVQTQTMLAMLVLLTGCISSSSLSRAMSYPAKSTSVQIGGDTYRVFEHAKDKTLMTAPTIAASAGMGMASGATLGLASVSSMNPEQKHEAAALQYLANTGRPNCTITKGYLLMDPQYEFTYECPAAVSSGTVVRNG